MNKKYVLMSIKPCYAEAIRSGNKTVELRKISPKLNKGDIIVIYESSPVMKITAYCEVNNIITLPKKELWHRVRNSAFISEKKYDEYFSSKNLATGIFLQNIISLATPKSLNSISDSIKAPQSYRYISEQDFLSITEDG